jgi:hypothetical protein
MAPMRRRAPFLLLSATLLMGAVAGTAGPAAGAKKCKPGVHKFDGPTKARKFCGPARATVELGQPVKFKPGECKRTKKYVSVNIGTIVLGPTDKKKPEYFGLNVGETPAGGTPAPKDGTYDDATISFQHNNKGYALGNATVTLTNKRTRGTFSGTLVGQQGEITGSFRCK